MKTPKIKRYRLGVSRNFPTTHPRKGKETWFTDKIQHALGKFEACTIFDHVNNEKIIVWPKIHTIRSNYELWSKRMAEVQAGRAVIELFYWSGKPYHKDENGIGQVVFATLNKDSGCWVQELLFFGDINTPRAITRFKSGSAETWDGPTEELAKNDGLSLDDFKSWFKGYDLSKPMAIIHFTSFRY